MGTPFGIDTWIYSILLIDEAIKRIKAHGMDFIEYSYEHFRKLSNDSFNPEEIARPIKEVANSYGVKATQIHGPFGEHDVEIASIDPSIRSRAMERIRRWIQLAASLGVDVLVMHTSYVEASVSEKQEHILTKARKANIDAFSQIAKVAQDYGVKVAVENRLEKIFAWRPADILELLESLDLDIVGMCFDTGHANVNNIPSDRMAKMLDGKIIATHLHDNDGSWDQHLPPLMGTIDWEALLKVFRSMSYAQPLILEVRESGNLKLDDNNVILSRLAMEHLASKAY